MKNHYQTLGVRPDATSEQIKSSYRRLSLKFHPDKNRGNLFFEERFQEIQEAYNILSNPEKRKIFDLLRKTSVDDQIDHSPFSEIPEEENILRNLEYTNTNIILVGVLILAITFLAILISI